MTMMTRQRNDYVREIDYLKNEVDALKYKKYMHSSYGVLSFIFACSFMLTYFQRDPELQAAIANKLTQYGINEKYELNMFDKTMVATMYHYIVFKAISHRFIVSVLIGLMFIACIPSAHVLTV